MSIEINLTNLICDSSLMMIPLIFLTFNYFYDLLDLCCCLIPLMSQLMGVLKGSLENLFHYSILEFFQFELSVKFKNRYFVIIILMKFELNMLFNQNVYLNFYFYFKQFNNLNLLTIWNIFLMSSYFLI